MWPFILTVIILIFLKNAYLVEKRYPEIRNFMPDLKSGDLLLFRHVRMAWATHYLLGDEFSHLGMVFQDSGGARWVLESTTGDDDEFSEPTKSGPRLTELGKCLREYQGRICLNRLSHPLDIARVIRFQQMVPRYLLETFGEPRVEYIATCVLKRPNGYSGAAYCSMFIARILQDLRVVRLRTPDICMRPESFIRVSDHADSVDGYHFSGNLVELKF